MNTVWRYWEGCGQVDSGRGHAVEQYDWYVWVKTGAVEAVDSQGALVKGVLVRAQWGTPS